MSGHSKWHTIKHKKAALDSKRGKLFTRLIKEIVIAARNGGDPDGNPRLRTAITAAKAVSMPNDNIQRAIKRGTGELAGDEIIEVMYEGYGPGGAALLVAAATDNRNRTVSDVRSIFTKHGGNMGEPGSVAWMFKRRSSVVIEKAKATEDTLMNLVLEVGGEDLRDDGETWTILSDPNAHDAMVAAVEKAKIETVSAEIAYTAENTIKLDGAQARSMLKLYDALDDHDDVQNIWGNFEIDEADVE
ncbi:MAG: YebC/PmpR family DNA-binding transcriptional regulator [Bryobacteraceae bacterium]|nr:YebC/PmpR family DNA-binding transcriptional regulator [Bryobacteraceae bacterium]